MKKLRSPLLLVLAAFIWGAAFSAQSIGTEFLGPFSFNGIRFIIGALVLLPVAILIDMNSRKKNSSMLSGSDIESTTKKYLKKHPDRTDVSLEELICFRKHQTVKAGIICGCVLFIASNLQQYGITYVTPGQAGFITALYVILVPIFAVIAGKRGSAFTWICAVLAVIGMYFLCLSDSEDTINLFGNISVFGLFEMNSRYFGYIIEFLCAIGFTFHIIVIDKFSPGLNGVKISCIQFFTAGILSFIFMIITEDITFSDIVSCILPLLYTGVFSSGIAYTLQIVGQKNTPPTIASLLMSLESVFSALTGWMFLHIKMSAGEIIGCIIVFTAIIISQLPFAQPKE